MSILKKWLCYISDLFYSKEMCLRDRTLTFEKSINITVITKHWRKIYVSGICLILETIALQYLLGKCIAIKVFKENAPTYYYCKIQISIFWYIQNKEYFLKFPQGAL